MEQQLEQTQPTWKSVLASAVGLGVLWAAWYLHFPPWLAIIVVGLVVIPKIERYWHKTIRPAIIELIREALR